MTRNVFYGGKGGVGKTTCAAATGLALADRGHRTLVVSTDPAHSLGDVLEVELGGEPREVRPDLWGVEADPDAGQATYRQVVEVLSDEFRSAGISVPPEDVERLFDAGFVPGSDEVAALEYLGTPETAEPWDQVVFDTAPTGHTLRLLTLPDVLRESLSAVGDVRSEVRRLVASARSVVVGPAAFVGRDDGDEIEAVRDRMDRAAAELTDLERTDFRVVLLPESLAVTESRRFVDRLDSVGVPVTTVVVNRLLESVDESCARCRERRAAHEQVRAEVDRAFPDRSVRSLPDLGHEARGRSALAELGDRLVE